MIVVSLSTVHVSVAKSVLLLFFMVHMSGQYVVVVCNAHIYVKHVFFFNVIADLYVVGRNVKTHEPERFALKSPIND